MYWNNTNRPVRRIPVQAMDDRYTRPYRQTRSFNGHHPSEPREPRQQTVAEPEPQISDPETPTPSTIDWQEKATRLQAEMDNFRKNQTRRANETIAHERERLLDLMLPVIDNLSRALQSSQADYDSLQRGVDLTYREMLRGLKEEGLTQVETIGSPFDPYFHEALATTPSEAESGIIVEEVSAGYKLGEKLLRPAKVIVSE
ncbi:MAG: nucleotide exchange factor GrpE [Chloroflexota bacterium]